MHRIEANEVDKFLSTLDSFDAVVMQPVAAGYRNYIGIDTDNLRSRMLPDQRLVLVPNLHFEGFFPTWGYMKYKNGNLRGKMPLGLVPDCASEGIFATLRRTDYQCFFLLCAWFQGLSIKQAAALLETSFDSELIRSWYTDSLAEFAAREKVCDTCMTPVLQNIVTQPEYQFYSVNHPNKALLTTLAFQVMDVLKIESKDEETLRNRVDSLPDRLDQIQLPVYPFVSSSLGLENKRTAVLRIYDSVISIPEFVGYYYAYFDCLGKNGLSVNRDHKKYKLCEKLINHGLIMPYTPELRKRIKSHLEERSALIRDCVISMGRDPELCVEKAIPQSALFMVELIPVIHRLYMGLPTNAKKTALDVGPSCFGGTALLADLHTEQSYNKLKLKVSAVDIVDFFRPVQEMLAPNVEFFVQDIFTIENRVWDFIICSHVIEHVPNPSAFLRQLQSLARDFVLVACPWHEKPLTTKRHINTIDDDFVLAVGGRDLQSFVNYGWGKQRKVCAFWLPGSAAK